MGIKYSNFDELKSYGELMKETPYDLQEMDSARVAKCDQEIGGGLRFNYAAKSVTESILGTFQAVADEQQLIDKYKEILNGEFMNTGENRKVLHHLVRGQQGADVVYEGNNLREFYVEQQKRVDSFSAKVQSGEIKGSTGKKFKNVVQIGIGGSDLGPRAIYLSLANRYDRLMEGLFISNVDPDDANGVLEGIDFESTLFILVSKSGTTQETLANQNFAFKKMENAAITGFDPSKHMIAVTSATSPLAGSDAVLDSFYIDDFIGGRFSSTSAVGGAVLSLCFGAKVFAEFLDGAAEADKMALNEKVSENATLMDALIGVYERNVMCLPSTVILPYSQALSRFPAHLQQCDMESNGKGVNRDGGDIDYVTGPVIFGEPGTNGQHSFYQLLHQGTDIVPLQFIGFKAPQVDFDLDFDGSTSQVKLNANLAAQIIAFAKGSKNDNPNKFFAGGRPSSLIYGEVLSAKAVGALLAHFENKVLFQGLIWNLNSFDQEGVQLGKKLTSALLSGESKDSAMTAFAKLLGV